MNALSLFGNFQIFLLNFPDITGVETSEAGQHGVEGEQCFCQAELEETLGSAEVHQPGPVHPETGPGRAGHRHEVQDRKENC